MVPSLFTEKHDDFYQQASSIVGLSVPFQVQNGGKDYPMLRAVGYRVSPKSGPLCLFLRTRHHSDGSFSTDGGCIRPNATGSTGLHCTSSRSYHKHISKHLTKFSLTLLVALT